MMAKSAKPFLMFQDHTAEAAMNLYISLFPGAAITSIERYGADGPGREGSVRLAEFSLLGQSVMCIDSPAKHAFGFTPSFSFFVQCDDEAELRRLHAALSKDGTELMPLNNYGFSQLFCWINDRFGVSWQINLA